MPELSRKIYEKVYIHLPSANAPKASLIMNELKNDAHRSKLAEIVFDLEKFTPTILSAQDCVIRLEKNWINLHIQSLRDELKNAESMGKDPLSIMKNIEKLQNQKNNISHQYSTNE